MSDSRQTGQYNAVFNSVSGDAHTLAAMDNPKETVHNSTNVKAENFLYTTSTWQWIRPNLHISIAFSVVVTLQMQSV